MTSFSIDFPPPTGERILSDIQLPSDLGATDTWLPRLIHRAAFELCTELPSLGHKHSFCPLRGSLKCP
jgi:hypothetical protein